MKYSLHLQSTGSKVTSIVANTEPKPGDVIQFEGQRYLVQGRTGGSHGVGYTDGTPPPITSVSMWVDRI